ncbi:MAG: adaptor protein MecA [Oscillospiraceae bacterium]|nr:adaptor protein MecA [Oscillospiraceae bacterium]
MNIEIIDDTMIKLVLSKQDLINFDITYNDMDYKNEKTRYAIDLIIDKIYFEKNIDLKDKKLIIEAFPTITKGCIFYIKIIDKFLESIKKNEEKYPVEEIEPINIESLRDILNLNIKEINTKINIYNISIRLEDIESLISISKIINTYYIKLILKNSIYKVDNIYYLLLETKTKVEKNFINHLFEYSNDIEKDSLKYKIIKEHGIEIINKNAIETISQKL